MGSKYHYGTERVRIEEGKSIAKVNVVELSCSPSLSSPHSFNSSSLSLQHEAPSEGVNGTDRDAGT